MNVTDPIRRVSVVSTGQVQIRPDHVASTWRPTALWLLTSRTWTPPRPINAYIIEHRDGLVLFDTGQDRASVTEADYFPGGMTGFLYGRLAQFDIGAQQTLTSRPGPARLRNQRRQDRRHFPSSPGPHRRPGGTERRGHCRQPG